ncbi:substrate-binding periplasmic protein [Microbacterium trichothecenolyticum]|uniref:Polar amino acid transport system substrate-binding protein n=1 Tax=Microbacterium trichothecenolyticum TaxID=69370 RepID=A0ABU0TS65_MICTR|nr:transporter substrate-binding domain-containing protein [Microbacterium trichothecenolyticum]MDQ1122515.1 polar amino acid transport system substrate-binding protein [Microbacterium trichothecenolyticum]
MHRRPTLSRPLRHVGLLASAAAVTALALSGCSSPQSTVADGCTPAHEGITTVSSGKLTVGVIDIVPFSSYNSGEPAGIDVDIVKDILEKECLEPVWQQATYADAVQSISNGTLDIAIGTIDATEKRLKAVDFSASTYLDGMGIVSKDGQTSVADIEKSTGQVGTIEGYLWVDDLRAILGDRLQTYPSSVELKADFDAGRLTTLIDAYGTAVAEFPGDDSVKIALANKTPDSRVKALEPAPEAAFPLTKGNTSLKTAISDDIEAMRADGAIAGLLSKAGLDPDLGKVQATQYIVPAS